MRNSEKWQPRNCKGKQRLCSFKSYLTTSKESIPVCKTVFLDTFNVSVGHIDQVLQASVLGTDLSTKKQDLPQKQMKNLQLLLKIILKIFLHLKAITQHITTNKENI
jgi:hypothetical protein